MAVHGKKHHGHHGHHAHGAHGHQGAHKAHHKHEPNKAEKAQEKQLKELEKDQKANAKEIAALRKQLADQNSLTPTTAPTSNLTLPTTPPAATPPAAAGAGAPPTGGGAPPTAAADQQTAQAQPAAQNVDVDKIDTNEFKALDGMVQNFAKNGNIDAGELAVYQKTRAFYAQDAAPAPQAAAPAAPAANTPPATATV